MNNLTNPQLPANLPASELLALLRERREVRYEAVELPPCFKLRVLGPLGAEVVLRGDGKSPAGLDVPGGWAVIAVTGESRAVVVLGLVEGVARNRANLLNLRTAPTGFHLPS